MRATTSILNSAFAFLAIIATTSFATAIAGSFSFRGDTSDVDVAVDTMAKWEGYSYTCTKASIEVKEEDGKWYMTAWCPKMDRKSFLKSKLDLDKYVLPQIRFRYFSLA
ncbi:hypothetical protein DL765_010031 [Monosporascus sp. GIB2]|nr:hypothetical protein DL765_010031 [Monosporascus sp. GIB2]